MGKSSKLKAQRRQKPTMLVGTRDDISRAPEESVVLSFDGHYETFARFVENTMVGAGVEVSDIPNILIVPTVVDPEDTEYQNLQDYVQNSKQVQQTGLQFGIQTIDIRIEDPMQTVSDLRVLTEFYTEKQVSGIVQSIGTALRNGMGFILITDSTGILNLVPQSDSIRSFMTEKGLNY